MILSELRHYKGIFVSFESSAKTTVDQVQTQLYLLLIIILQCILVSLLQPSKRKYDFCGPPDLSSAESDLGRVVEQPLVTWFFFIGHNSFGQLVAYCGSHSVHNSVKPNLNLKEI